MTLLRIGQNRRKIMESESEKVIQSCPTLCDPMDNTVHGILQARILEGVVFPFSRGSFQPRDWTQVSCIAGGFFTSWATREAHELLFCFLEWKLFAVAETFRVGCYSLVTWSCLQGGHPDGNSLRVVQRRLAGIPPHPDPPSERLLPSDGFLIELNFWGHI